MVLTSPLPLAAVAPWLTTWLTTLWLLSAGVLVGLVVLLLLWAILFVVRREAATQVPLALGEGVLLPITFVAVITAVFGIAGALFVRQPASFLDSLVRLPYSGEQTIAATIPPASDASQETVRHAIPIGVRGDELREISITSDQYVELADAEDPEKWRGPAIELGPDEPFTWSKSKQGGSFYGGDFVGSFYVANQTTNEAQVNISLDTRPVLTEVSAIPMMAAFVVLMYVLYFAQAWFFPRVSAIALATTKSEIAQPMFGIMLSIGVFLILLFQFLPYNTFGEDIKMLKDSGLTLIMVLAIIQGVWAASNSVSEEIEGRTALTVLSKPIGRRQFILGKLLGILWTVALLFIILGIVFLVVIAYKPVYDARELGSETPTWEIAHREVVRTIPGLVLAFFEATVMVSVSVAISTRLPMLANFVICFAIYVLGHLTPLIVQAPIDFAPVVFVGQLIATILPVLDHFNIQAAVAAGAPVPLEYLLMAFVYCMLYSLIAVLLALALFEDRDLA